MSDDPHADLHALVALAHDLRQEKKRLDAELEEVNAVLLERLRPLGAFTSGDIRAAVRSRPARLKVSDKGALPAVFWSAQPDTARLQSHFEETGELLPGTTLVEESTWVEVKSRPRR